MSMYQVAFSFLLWIEKLRFLICDFYGFELVVGNIVMWEIFFFTKLKSFIIHI